MLLQRLDHGGGIELAKARSRESQEEASMAFFGVQKYDRLPLSATVVVLQRLLEFEGYEEVSHVQVALKCLSELAVYAAALRVQVEGVERL